ncbi:hypothetical protein BAE44_0004741 [Dichanthelium oligosanthes]|uniref:F-box domain-containing protein n=1 Tax=Dichanthelium oligosanthes TaxID=888268 RepID=A0A1E5W9Y5_9POAL|nr:hypothetical protein BAE44_0004741 [Dichanthelium oligosanthes]
MPRCSSRLLRCPAAASKVLGDDDLIGDILIRLIFPNSLVRAALVYRRWLRVASETAFLRRFYNLHPSCLLGFYVEHKGITLPKFVPMPNPPTELAAAVRRASSAVGDAYARGTSVKSILNCLNGRLLVSLHSPDCRDAVLTPIHPGRDAIILLASLHSYCTTTS